MERLLLAAVTLLAAAIWTPIAAAATGSARAHASANGCNLYASPAGSDSRGHGGVRRPFRTLTRLDRALRPGQTGCLEAGTYGDIGTWHKIFSSGTPSARVTVTSAPGQAAKVVGFVDIEGSYTTVSHLQIDGSNTLYKGGNSCRSVVSQALIIAGHDDIFEGNNYYQSVPGLRANGIGVGFWGNADNTVIRFNKIHDVGQCDAFDHLIYLAHGNNVQIYGNWMWNDPHGRGVQLYPGPTNARVFGNVIDHAGEGFVIGDEAGSTVSGNQVFDNIITHSSGLPWERIPGWAIHDMYGGAPGTGNSFHNNIIFQNPAGMGRWTRVRAYGNRTLNPHFVNPAGHDYRVQSGFKRRLERLFAQP
jgi:Right handed beta helix region